MRSLYLSTVLIVLNSLYADAQVGYGPELGIGLSNIKFAPPTYPVLYTSASVKYIPSGKVGGLVDVPMHRHLYFQAGIFFSRKGAERSFSYYVNDSFNESVHQKLYINYFELPLSVLFKSGSQGKGRFITGLGATPSYIAGGTSKMTDHLVNNGIVTNTDNNDKITVGKTLSGFDIGIQLSAGYELPTGLYFRAYFNAGANDIGEGTEIVKNRMLGISAGYLFGKGRNINKEKDDLIDKGSD